MGRPKGSKNKVKTANYRTIAYKYYCGKCSKNFSFIIDFDYRLKQTCPICEQALKYLGGCDIGTSSTGNCSYCSAERGSEQNIKRIGKDAYNQMCDADPIIGKRRQDKEEAKKMWWREDGKPLDLSKIKDTKKYIETGDKN